MPVAPDPELLSSVLHDANHFHEWTRAGVLERLPEALAAAARACAGRNEEPTAAQLGNLAHVGPFATCRILQLFSIAALFSQRRRRWHYRGVNYLRVPDADFTPVTPGFGSDGWRV